jgi:hypothetical protein
MKKKTIFLIFLCLLFINKIEAQVNLSINSEISLITAGPGEELYEKFGHSAFRVVDTTLNIDLIYNYGIFDFNAPNFYSNFAKGKMYYLVAKYDFKYFLASYKQDKRWLKQQILNLDLSEKQRVFDYLENNVRKENATYLYDPFFDNCATKLRDILQITFGNNIALNSTNISNNQTLRALMDQEIYWNTWGNFGINIIAGTILDKKRSQLSYTYLPDQLYNTFKYARIKRENVFIPLVEKERVLLSFTEQATSLKITSPVTVFSIFLIIVLFISFKDLKNNKRSRYLDFIIFFITGLVGLLLTYLWLFSSHTTAPNNFNILWAFLPNLWMAFSLRKKNVKVGVKKYILLLLFTLGILPFLWFFKIQAFPFAAIPIFLLLFIRYLFLYKYLSSLKKAIHSAHITNNPQ